MANHLISISPFTDYHEELIEDFHAARAALKRSHPHINSRVQVHIVPVRNFSQLRREVPRLAGYSHAPKPNNKVLILTSGLLNRDFSAKTFPESVLEVADDSVRNTSTIVLGNADLLTGHQFGIIHSSAIQDIMYRAVFERQELGRKIFLSCYTAKETVVERMLHEFYPEEVPVTPERFIPSGQMIRTPT